MIFYVIARLLFILRRPELVSGSHCRPLPPFGLLRHLRAPRNDVGLVCPIFCAMLQNVNANFKSPKPCHKVQ